MGGEEQGTRLVCTKAQGRGWSMDAHRHDRGRVEHSPSARLVALVRRRTRPHPARGPLPCPKYGTAACNHRRRAKRRAAAILHAGTMAIHQDYLDSNPQSGAEKTRLPYEHTAQGCTRGPRKRHADCASNLGRPASRRPGPPRPSRRSTPDSTILAAHAGYRGARTLGAPDDAAPFVTSRRSRGSSFCHP